MTSDVRMGTEYKRADLQSGAADISPLICSSYRGCTVARMDTIGKRVKALRRSRQMNQSELSKALGKGVASQAAISMIETGETKSLSGIVLARLCSVLVTTPEFIIEGAGTAEDHEAAMEVAEITNIAQRLGHSARRALLDSARLVQRATLGQTAADPWKNGPPDGIERRRTPDRREQYLNPDRDHAQERRDR